MTRSIFLDPLLPWPMIVGLFVIALISVILAGWKGLSGWGLRALTSLVILGSLMGPIYQEEIRTSLTDIVLLIEDASSSQSLSDRSEQMAVAIEDLSRAIASRDTIEIRRVRVADVDDDGGTQLMTALSEALATESPSRIAGIIAVTDGRIHDIQQTPTLPAPMHVLLTGRQKDWDRRIIVKDAPSYAILGEPVTFTIRIESDGAVPVPDASVELHITVDRQETESRIIPVGEDIPLQFTLTHSGRNVIQFSIDDIFSELTNRNNSALVQVNGIRDRLRVLLVSGEPHQGGRAWRNLLKSDSLVDLVHFTILRPPEKQDGVLVNELSLIAFPTRELFLEKISDFDLIIFDRFKRRGILPAIYLENVAEYVRNGGAVLISAGPAFASADSIFRSPLSSILPAEPSARIIQQRFNPTITDIGERHPVTSNLPRRDSWGSWLRQVEVHHQTGNTLMTGVDQSPLLILDRVNDGRVALLTSDHAWLWSRGYEGGGPQLELLRRLAHWMMKEPELEEETLWAETSGQIMQIIRRTLKTDIGPVQIVSPSGETQTIELEAVEPGRFEATYEAPETGLYRLIEGDQRALIGLGPAAPREFEKTLSDGALLESIVSSVDGGLMRLEDGLPTVRFIREGRRAAGRGWIGLTPRDAYATDDVRQFPLLPAWLVLLVASSLIAIGWLREGRS